MLPSDLATMNRSKIIEAEIEGPWRVRQHVIQINTHSQASDIADRASEDCTGRCKDLTCLIDRVARQPPPLLDGFFAASHCPDPDRPSRPVMANGVSSSEET